jgi:hypothetical protein
MEKMHLVVALQCLRTPAPLRGGGGCTLVGRNTIQCVKKNFLKTPTQRVHNMVAILQHFSRCFMPAFIYMYLLTYLHWLILFCRTMYAVIIICTFNFSKVQLTTFYLWVPRAAFFSSAAWCFFYNICVSRLGRHNSLSHMSKKKRWGVS